MSRTDEIRQIATALGNSNLPSHVKYRYTFPENTSLEDQIDLARGLAAYICDNYALERRYTLGVEHFTKGMIAARPHVHIHFRTRINSKTIRDTIARVFEFHGRCQSCKTEVLVDESKFWRYPFKQQSGQTGRLMEYGGFTQAEAEIMRDVANACWLQSAEVLLRKKEKKEERTSRDRLLGYLDKIHPQKPFTSIRQTRLVAYAYYAEFEDALNINTVDSYVAWWLVKNKIMSLGEFHDSTH